VIENEANFGANLIISCLNCDLFDFGDQHDFYKADEYIDKNNTSNAQRDNLGYL